MIVQRLGHAALLVEVAGVRLLIDPGTYAAAEAFESRDLDAILVTHQHADHVDPDRLAALLTRNPQAQLMADEATAQQLRDSHGLDATVARAGSTYDVGVSVEVIGETHAEIHRDIPRIPNVGYVVDGRFFHPGDALTPPDREVEILALPAAAPWMRAADAVEYFRAVAPRIAVPIHEAISAVPALYYGILRNLGPDGSELRVIDDGIPAQI